MAYNTNNPVGSTDPRDLYDNAGNLDKFVNGDAPFYPDRLGRQRKSWSGMDADFASAQEGREAAFDQFLEASAFIWIGDYGAGLTFTSRSQYTVRDGYAYRLAESTTIPYTSTGNWALEQTKFSLVNRDDILRQDLSSVEDPEKGAALVGFDQTLSYPANTLGAALAKAIQGSGLTLKSFGAVGDGMADDSDAIELALSQPRSVDMQDGSFRITRPIVAVRGSALFSNNGTAGTFTHSDGSIIFDGGARILVDFGAAHAPENYFSQAAITLNTGCVLKGFSFHYPQQLMNVTTPVAYPPAIAVNTGCRGAVISDVNLGNSYVGIDARRDHGNLYIDRVTGYPLYRGIRLGSMIDNDYISNVHFNAMRVLSSPPGELWIQPNPISWSASNGFGVELNRVSWTLLHSVFCYGYSVGIRMLDQAASPSEGITVGGAPETVHVVSCGFDSCHEGIRATGNVWGLHVHDSFFAPRNPYDLTQANAAAIYFNSSSPGDKDLNISKCRVWSATHNVFTIINADGVIVSENRARNYASHAAGNGIYLQDSPNAQIMGNDVRAGNFGNSPNGIFLNGNCPNSVIAMNKLRDMGGSPIRLVASDYCAVEGNIGNGNTLPLITDSSLSANSKFSGNIDNGHLPDYTNMDVVAGILSTRKTDSFVRYSGTATLLGLGVGHIGQSVVIRFGASCIVTDADAGTAQANRLFLNGNFSAVFGGTLSLVSSGSLGWYEVSRSAN